MGNWRTGILFFLTLLLLLSLAECKKKKKTSVKKPSTNDTNLFKFIQLVVYRLIYGFATMFGAQESISEFMGGIFVPPGVDEDGDYRDYLDGEDEDYYDY